ncbi:response regulator [Paenibacillus sp. LjRoot153]|uniref:response regulator transcription factor n=1 Tax=Paenibacillus sp. LjRoot153 TaxID=3342270 RepID=UPI003ECF28CC
MSTNRIIKVIVIEDETAIRDHIIRKIEQTASDFKVIASAFNGKEGLQKIIHLKPDAIFTDIRMPIMDGLELITEIRKLMPDLPIVVLSGYNDFDYARQALRLGVSEYLLKPLTNEALYQTQTNIRRIVYSKFETIERKIISSELSGSLPPTNVPAYFDNSFFLIYLLGIGNLSNYMTLNNRIHFFEQCWAKFNWEQIIKQLPLQTLNWWVIDEKLSNQKFLVLSVAPNKDIEPEAVTRVLHSLLIQSVSPYPVSIATDYSNSSNQGLWDTAQKLRLAFEKGIVLGKSSFINNFDPQVPEKPNIQLISPAFSTKISSLLEPLKNDIIKKLIFDLFDAWEVAEFPQRLVEKGFMELIQTIQKGKMTTLQVNTMDLESLLLEQVSEAIDFKSACDRVWNLIDSMLLVTTHTDPSSEIADKIERYLKDNYVEDISLEELANRFNFTSAYLTKIFKKYKHETPLKYVINLKIEESKRLIVEHPSLDLKVIAEMVGYFDQHYFSKVFKSMVGKTPTDFRLEHRK